MNNRMPPTPPAGPPPNMAPKYCFSRRKELPKGIMPCINRYVYIWLQNKNSFWMVPVKMDNRTITGYIWTDTAWKLSVFNWRQINSFY